MRENKHLLGKAVCVAESFLTGWGLDVAREDFEGHSVLRIGGENGLSVCVSESPIHTCDITLDPRILGGRDLAAQFEELSKVAAQFNVTPAPLRPQSNGWASPSDYHEVCMRLTLFRKTVNPPAEVLAKYEQILKQQAKKAAYRYADVLQGMNYEWTDLYTIAQIYFINHYHSYRTGNSYEENVRFMITCLRREFSRWAKVSKRMLRSVYVKDRELIAESISSGYNCTARANSHGQPEGYEMSLEPPEVKENLSRLQREKNRAAARAALEAGLARMPHDRMIEELSRVANNPSIHDPQASKLAAKLLREHSNGCQKCVVPAPA